jgi:hypothetical protein
MRVHYMQNVAHTHISTLQKRVDVTGLTVYPYRGFLTKLSHGCAKEHGFQVGSHPP